MISKRPELLVIMGAPASVPNYGSCRGIVVVDGIRIIFFEQFIFAEVPAAGIVEHPAAAPAVFEETFFPQFQIVFAGDPAERHIDSAQLEIAFFRERQQRTVIPEFRTAVNVAAAFIGAIRPFQRDIQPPGQFIFRLAPPQHIMRLIAPDVRIVLSAVDRPAFRERVVILLDHALGDPIGSRSGARRKGETDLLSGVGHEPLRKTQCPAFRIIGGLVPADRIIHHMPEKNRMVLSRRGGNRQRLPGGRDMLQGFPFDPAPHQRFSTDFESRIGAAPETGRMVFQSGTENYFRPQLFFPGIDQFSLAEDETVPRRKKNADPAVPEEIFRGDRAVFLRKILLQHRQFFPAFTIVKLQIQYGILPFRIGQQIGQNEPVVLQFQRGGIGCHCAICQKRRQHHRK